MSKWEYRVVKDQLKGNDLEEVLNRLGEQGWEVIQAQAYVAQGTVGAVAFLKREVTGEGYMPVAFSGPPRPA